MRTVEFEKALTTVTLEKNPGKLYKVRKTVKALLQFVWRPTEALAFGLFAFQIWWNKGIPQLLS